MAQAMRLQKYLAQCGVASRRAAEDMIARGLVSVNGRVITTAGVKIDPDRDSVTVNGKLIKQAEELVYIMLNKPRGYVTTVRDDRERKTVMELIPEELGRVYPVGRLDYDTEGLLLLTNDGAFTHRLTHPSHEISKTYLVKVSGIPSPEALRVLRTGVMLEGRKTYPAEVLVKRREANYAFLLITISEGRNRQVRKMCAAVGHKVVFLRRVAEGPLRLGDLPLGAWRHLTPEEVQSLGGNKRAEH